MKSVVCAICVLSAALGCSQPIWAQSSPLPTASISLPASTSVASQKASGVSLNYLDKTVRPQDDFYTYANGAWLKTAVIPDDSPRVGTFYEISEVAKASTERFLDNLRFSSPPQGSAKAKMKTFLATLLDDEFYNGDDLGVIKKDLDLIESALTHSDLAEVMGTLHKQYGTNAPFKLSIRKDQRDTDKKAAYIIRGNTLFPKYATYMSDKPTAVAQRKSYEDFSALMLKTIGRDDAEVRAARVLVYETKYATVSDSKWKDKALDKSYYPIKSSKLNRSYKGFDWERYLTAIGFDSDATLVVQRRPMIKALARVFQETDLETLKDHLTVLYLRRNASFLPKNIHVSYQNFIKENFTGAKEIATRKETAYESGKSYFSDVVNENYVKTQSSQKTRDSITAMVGYIRDVYSDNISQNDWMGDATKAEAQKKLAAIDARIAYPDTWQTYDDVKVDAKFALHTKAAVNSAQWDKDLQDLKDNSAQTDAWDSPLYFADAAYRPSENEIIITAGILQKPIFDPSVDAAANYGAIGMIIGHEFGHAFDNKGRERDAAGSDKDWWSKADEKRFKKKAKRLVDQFAAYEIYPNEYVNGWDVLGENIGDLTGVKVAYQAYQKSLNGQTAPIIDGLTGDQRFFIAYAQLWRGKVTPELKRLVFESDPHSLPFLRVNGILPHFDPWYAAFDVKEDDALYLPPEDRVSIW